MRRLLDVLWTLVMTPWILAGAFVLGTLGVLPFVVVPRGRREKYAVVAARWFARWALLLMGARCEVTGPTGGRGTGALLMSNHRSWVDVLMLIAYTDSIGLSKSSIFWIPFVGFYGWLAGAVFFDRSSAGDRNRARREVMEQVGAGARIHVFPEGTRTRDGALAEKVYLTLARDCFERGLPVIPCAVMGTEAVMPVSGMRISPFHRCRLDIGEPIAPAGFDDADSFSQHCWSEVARRVAALEQG